MATARAHYLKTAAAILLALLSGCSSAGTPAAPAGLASQPGQVQSQSQPIGRLDPTLPKGNGPRQAVFFSYIAMDDSLTEFAGKFLNAVQQTASNKVYSVAFADLQGPDNSGLYLMQPGAKTPETSFLSPTLKEVTSNDPAVLAATVNWAFSTYDGRFKAMDMFAHGGAYMGLGTDEHQVGSDKREIMTVTQFGQALRTGLKGRRLNLLNMLSCMMGSLEFAYELKDVTEVLVASEESIYANDDSVVTVTSEINRLLAGPNPDAKAIGRQLAITANAKNPDSPYLTVSAIDVDRLDDVKRTVNGLANALLRAWPTHREAILAAYDAVPELELAEIGGVGNRDLWAFCNQLLKSNHGPIRQVAGDVKAALRKALLHTRDREGAAANGLSIMMPARHVMRQFYNHELFKASLQSRFAQGTSWPEFMARINEASANVDQQALANARG